MVSSMTGYGRVQRVVDGFNILVEIKSVNHRFFEFTAKVPRMYGYLEEKLRAFIREQVTRGKLEAFVALEPASGVEEQIMLNRKLASGYISAIRELRDEFGLKDDLSVSTVAGLPDIFTVKKPQEDEERIWNAVQAVAADAISEMLAMKQAEGGRLRDDIVQKADSILAAVSRIEQRSPVSVEEYRKRLYTKMVEILKDNRLDENRILMEAAIYADKVAVDEETVRLRSHLTQMQEILCSGPPCGRRLDFLVQEMNREINTIGSKACDLEMSGYVVEVKAILEKIREQIQNIE